MTILIIAEENMNDIGLNLRDSLLNIFREIGVNFRLFSIDLDDLHECIGCFNCWVKTPGICRFNDVGRELNHAMIQCDHMILLSEVYNGCYSPTIKRVLDRSIPNVLPFFKKTNGEVHQAPRYRKYPQLMMIGYGENITAREEEVFRELNHANAINFNKIKAKTLICREQQKVEDTIDKCLAYLSNVKKGEWYHECILN